MANYGLYKNIEPSSIVSATSSLRKKVNTTVSNVTSLKGSLTDSVWKAGAKQTLFTAFDKINDEVAKQLLDKLSNADTIADAIAKYKAAEHNALEYAKALEFATEKTPASEISSWREGLRESEDTMNESERTVNGLI